MAPARLALFAAFFGLASLATAEVLVLENGDRLTGKLLGNENGILRFESDILGPISVAATRATIAPAAEKPTSTDLDLQLAATEVPGVPTAPSGPPAAASPTPPPPPPPSMTEATSQAKQPPAAEAAAAKTPPKNPWERRVELGVTVQSGRRDHTDLALRLNMERKSEANELRFQGRYLYGKTDDRPTTDVFALSGRLRHTLSPRSFVQGESRYERDRIKGIDHDLNQSVGIGRKLADGKSFKMNLGAGAAGRYRESRSQESGWSYFFDGFQDLSYAINSNFKVTQDLSVLFAPFDADEFTLKLNAAFTNKITNTLNLSMRYEFEYDRSLLPESRENQRILTSLGYAF